MSYYQKNSIVNLSTSSCSNELGVLNFACISAHPRIRAWTMQKNIHAHMIPKFFFLRTCSCSIARRLMKRSSPQMPKMDRSSHLLALHTRVRQCGTATNSVSRVLAVHTAPRKLSQPLMHTVVRRKCQHSPSVRQPIPHRYFLMCDTVYTAYVHIYITPVSPSATLAVAP